MRKVVHYYAFSIVDDNAIPVYERTFGTEAAADKWIDADREHRFVTVGMVPEEYYY